MRTSSRTVTIETFTSESHPQLTTEDPRLAEVLAWADEHPTAFLVVTTGRSKAWGRGSSNYLGLVRSSVEAASVVERLAVFRNAVLGLDGDRVLREACGGENLHDWGARFTLAHVADPGFTGGLFQQHAVWTDGRMYGRSCTVLDHTPATLEEVVDRFMLWVDPAFATSYVTVDGRVVRSFEGLKPSAVQHGGGP